MEGSNLYTDSEGMGECMSCGSSLFFTVFDDSSDEDAVLIAIKCAKCGTMYRPQNLYH